MLDDRQPLPASDPPLYPNDQAFVIALRRDADVAQGRLVGRVEHIVSGHVDGIGTITRFAPVGESWELRVLAPPALARFLAYKGSITVNGVSLTVNSVTDLPNGSEISINLIPHTVENTALGSLKDGSRVNLEIDTVARYVERMLQAGAIETPQKDKAP